MLIGCDLSHHNSDQVFQNVLEKEYDFIILKATEGKTFVDDKFHERVHLISELGIKKGFYHFARPDLNTYEAEVENFLSNVAQYSDAIYVLDWEGKAVNYNFEWALNWVNLVYRKTGIRPLIYASASVIKKHSTEYNLWWTAHYNENCKNGCRHDNVDEVMTQWNNEPYDLDIFHYDITAWKDLSGYSPILDELVYTFEMDGYEFKITRRKI